MKKRKREKLNRVKEQKRLEWERVKALPENELSENCHMIELDIDAMMDLHFMDEEYSCENCEDHLTGVCDGEGYTTYDECYKCMGKKVDEGERLIMYTNLDF